MMRIHKFAALFATLMLAAGGAWAQCDPNDTGCAERERQAAQAKMDEQQQQQPSDAPPPPQDAQQSTGGAQRATRPKKGGGG